MNWLKKIDWQKMVPYLVYLGKVAIWSIIASFSGNGNYNFVAAILSLFFIDVVLPDSDLDILDKKTKNIMRFSIIFFLILLGIVFIPVYKNVINIDESEGSIALFRYLGRAYLFLVVYVLFVFFRKLTSRSDWQDLKNTIFKWKGLFIEKIKTIPGIDNRTKK